MHAAPTVTHSFVIGQQVQEMWPILQICAASGRQRCQLRPNGSRGGGRTSSDAHALVSVGSQKVPAATGLRQCLASGQQNEFAGQTGGGAHTAPTETHTAGRRAGQRAVEGSCAQERFRSLFVSGQQVCPAAHLAVGLQAFGGAAGVRQCFASGQQ